MNHTVKVIFLAIGFSLIFNPELTLGQTKSEGGKDIEVLSASISEASIDFHVSDYSFRKKVNSHGNFFIVELPGYHILMNPGNPSLPVMKKIISVPAGADFEISLKDTVYKTVDLKEKGITEKMFPYQPTHRKDKSPPDFKLNRDIYQSDRYYKRSELVEMNYLGIARDVAIARLEIAPFQYNPVRNTLKIMERGRIEVKYKNPDLLRQQELNEKGYSYSFSPMKENILNGTGKMRDSIVTTPAKYVIVADSMFCKSLQPFIKWKTKKGFQIVEAYTSNPAVGTNPSSIKSFIQSHYKNATPADPAPSYVLLVGDIAQIPSFNGNTGSHPSDLYYAEFTGDTIPDAYLGRFSATDTAELGAQIRKTINYEKCLMPTSSYLDTTVLVAGNDNQYGPTHGNGQVNYIENEYLNLFYNFYTNKYTYPNSSNQKLQIIQNLNNGFSIANYTGHGYPSGWSDPQLYVSDLSQVQNTGEYGLMIGNACLTNDFSTTKCLGEAVLRLEDRGAIGYIGGSDNTYWDEDFYWSVGLTSDFSANHNYSNTGHASYDLLFHAHGEPYNKWFKTQGQMIFSGNMAVEAAASPKNTYYWEIYHLMGDPSLMPYLGSPGKPVANYNQMIPVGVNKLQVVTDPHAIIALSRNDSLCAVAQADQSGNATLNFQAFNSPGQAKLVITSQNKKPVIETINILKPGGPYILHENFDLNDSLGNGNGKAEYGEKIYLDETIKNFTSYPDTNVRVEINIQDTNLILLDDMVKWSSVPGDTALKKDDAFFVKLKNQVKDQHLVYFDVSISTNSGSWNSKFKIKLHAPDLKLYDAEIIEISGNGNGRLESGEIGKFSAKLYNRGTAEASNVQSRIFPDTAVVTLPKPHIDTLGNIDQGKTKNISYNFVLSQQAWTGRNYGMHLRAETGHYEAERLYTFMVGKAMEDWETGDFTRFHWIHKNKNPWVITDTISYQGKYCARSDPSLGNEEKSILSISTNIIQRDSLSFNFRTSSEKDYDFLEFWMDNKLLGKWSGQDSSWRYVSFSIPEGYHEFRWRYTKDYGWDEGKDAVWIDNIIFPPNNLYSDVEKQPTEAEFNIYPNPVNNNLFITTTGESISVISLWDLTGRLVLKQKVTENSLKHKLSLGQIKNGVYILRLRLESGGSEIRKIIKR